MENTDQQKKAIEKFQRQEKRSWVRMFLLSAIPIIITAILVYVSWNTVEQAEEKVNMYRDSVALLQEDLNIMVDSLEQIREAYEFAITYKDQRFELDYTRDKELYSRYEKQSMILIEVKELIETNATGWKLRGTTIEEGFDSPSFATYMINKYSQTNVPLQQRYDLPNLLEKIDSPKVGDIVFYEQGFAMIYFRTQGQPFVVGMTPVGLAALEINFGPRILGYGKVNY